MLLNLSKSNIKMVTPKPYVYLSSFVLGCLLSRITEAETYEFVVLFFITSVVSLCTNYIPRDKFLLSSRITFKVLAYFLGKITFYHALISLQNNKFKKQVLLFGARIVIVYFAN